MIRVSRGSEPPALRRERRRRLSRAILDRRAGRPVDFTGYDVAKDELVKALNYKCVFCEMPLHKDVSPVEHFRPKACVENKGAPRDESRYWWLAWTWENLLFACPRCNTGYKRNKFPLDPGTPPLAELSFDLDAERPLLIDPATVDPREHIRFRWSEKRARWLPVPVAGSEMGEKTVEDLALEEADQPTEHVRERVDAWVEQLADILKQENPQAVHATWNRMCRSLFAPRQPFHAVTRDALEMRVPEHVRRRWELALPSIGQHRTAPPSPTFDPADDPPGLADLPEALQLRVRALGHSTPEAEMLDLLRELLQAPRTGGGWTDNALAGLLGRTEVTIRGYRRKLR